MQVSAKEQGPVVNKLHDLETSSEEGGSGILSENFSIDHSANEEVEISSTTNGSSDNYTLPLPEQIIELLGKSILVLGE